MPPFFRAFLNVFRGVPLRTVWGLVWPQLMMLLCTIVISLTDIWTAGKIGSEVQAAVGLSFQIQVLLLVFGMALGSGGMASVSQSMGAGRTGRAQSYVGLVLSACLVVAFLVGGIVWMLRGPVLAFLQTPESLLPLTAYMVSIMLMGLPFLYVVQVGGTLFRAARQVMAPLFVVMVSCVLNVFGDLGFGLGWFGMPDCGVAGIAWSTFASNVVACVMTFVFLRRGGLISRRIVPAWRWIRRGAPYLFKVALPACGNSILWHSGYLVMYAITAALPDGVDALAGMTAGGRIEAILYMPGTAFMVTASILVGNALGAGDRGLARRTGLALFFLSGLSMGTVAACLWPFIPELSRAFSSELAVQDQIGEYLFYNVLIVPFTVSGLVMHGVMNGSGATIYSMVVNSAAIWTVRLPLGWLLAHRIFGDAEGIYMAMAVSMILQTSAMVWVFFRKDWASFAINARPLPASKEKP